MSDQLLASDFIRLRFFKIITSKSWKEIHSDTKQAEQLTNVNTWDPKLFMTTMTKNTKGGRQKEPVVSCSCWRQETGSRFTKSFSLLFTDNLFWICFKILATSSKLNSRNSFYHLCL